MGEEAMKTIHVRSRSNGEGILHLDVPVNLKDAELDITVTIEPVAPGLKGRGYPPGFFEQTYGSCQDDPIVIDEEGIYEDTEEVL